MIFPTVVKKILLNGLVILVQPVHDVPQVSMQMWYHVGSKDEKSGEKGLAHLVEHMIFKGTKKLSETDYRAITHKLSGYANAWTYYDYTYYTFDLPCQHWKYGLFLFADTMRNCRFDEQMLNSELKAVIQELKMYRDNYDRSLMLKLFEGIYYDHPYKYPVIGFKQDLWSLNRQALVAFYKRHYIPNNATLVVVGDVDPEEIFKTAECYFGSIPADFTYKKEEFYHGKDLTSVGVTMYRQIQDPRVKLCVVLPGMKTGNKWDVEALSYLLGNRKSGILTQLLVDEKKLVNQFETSCFATEDATNFFFNYKPKRLEDIPLINQLISEELENLKKNIPNEDLVRTVKLTKLYLLNLLESTYESASALGQAYTVMQDERYAFGWLQDSPELLKEKFLGLLRTYFHTSAIHQGTVLPLLPEDERRWHEIQLLSDQEDARILDGRVRNSLIEGCKYASCVKVQTPKKFSFAKPTKNTLSNGIKVFSYDTKKLGKIELLLALKTRSEDEPDGQEGVYAYIAQLLLEGTKNYPGIKLIQELDRHGIILEPSSGYISISVLKEDLPKALELLQEVVQNAHFTNNNIEKVRAQMLSQISDAQENSLYIARKRALEGVYKDHPFAKERLGNTASLKNITRKDLVTFYKKVFSPDGARIALVGDLTGYDIAQELEKTLGSWKGCSVVKKTMPIVKPVSTKTLIHTINRDQVQLAFAGLSIKHSDPDFEKVLLLEQMVTLGSHARLFQLREQTGIFYAIGGYLTAYACEEPGMVLLEATVSVDKLEEAKKLIRKEIEDSVDTLTQKELDDAKQVLIHQQKDWFSSAAAIASTFLYLDRYKLGDDYFDKRPEVLRKITLKDVKEVARKILDVNKMIIVQVGRV